MKIKFITRYSYYKHQKRNTYFDRIGSPIKIGFIEYYILKIFNCRVTKALKGTPVTEVLVQAAIASGCGEKSYRVIRIRELGVDVE